MIITDKSEEYQKLLKRVEYLENVLMAAKYYCGCDPWKEDKPEFKVGDWVCLKKEHIDNNKGRVLSIDYKGQVAIQIPEYSYDEKFYERIDDLRLMTVEEIESHLKKICDEKGYKEGTKIRCMDKGNIRTLERPEEWFYNNSTDSFHGCTPQSEWEGGYSNPWIYHQGKFAALVPDKKKLPKTKTELIDFITHYEDVRHGCLEGISISNFFDQYED